MEGDDKMFKAGDYVSLTHVTKEDISHSRYVGEVGVFQGYDKTGYAMVKFGEWGGYYVNDYALSLSRSATIDSILYAYCYENDTDLSDRLNEYVKENKKEIF